MWNLMRLLPSILLYENFFGIYLKPNFFNSATLPKFSPIFIVLVFYSSYLQISSFSKTSPVIFVHYYIFYAVTIHYKNGNFFVENFRLTVQTDRDRVKTRKIFENNFFYNFSHGRRHTLYLWIHLWAQKNFQKNKLSLSATAVRWKFFFNVFTYLCFWFSLHVSNLKNLPRSSKSFLDFENVSTT